MLKHLAYFYNPDNWSNELTSHYSQFGLFRFGGVPLEMYCDSWNLTCSAGDELQLNLGSYYDGEDIGYKVCPSGGSWEPFTREKYGFECHLIEFWNSSYGRCNGIYTGSSGTSDGEPAALLSPSLCGNLVSVTNILEMRFGCMSCEKRAVIGVPVGEDSPFILEAEQDFGGTIKYDGWSI